MAPAPQEGQAYDSKVAAVGVAEPADVRTCIVGVGAASVVDDILGPREQDMVGCEPATPDTRYEHANEPLNEQVRSVGRDHT